MGFLAQRAMLVLVLRGTLVLFGALVLYGNLKQGHFAWRLVGSCSGFFQPAALRANDGCQNPRSSFGESYADALYR